MLACPYFVILPTGQLSCIKQLGKENLNKPQMTKKVRKVTLMRGLLKVVARVETCQVLHTKRKENWFTFTAFKRSTISYVTDED